jgi:hypothetical protein
MSIPLTGLDLRFQIQGIASLPLETLNTWVSINNQYEEFLHPGLRLLLCLAPQELSRTLFFLIKGFYCIILELTELITVFLLKGSNEIVSDEADDEEHRKGGSGLTNHSPVNAHARV